MTAEEMQSVIVYLTDKVEKLEQQKLCECGKTEAPVEYKATPKEMFVTNYDEDRDTLSDISIIASLNSRFCMNTPILTPLLNSTAPIIFFFSL